MHKISKLELNDILFCVFVCCCYFSILYSEMFIDMACSLRDERLENLQFSIKILNYMEEKKNESSCSYSITLSV